MHVLNLLFDSVFTGIFATALMDGFALIGTRLGILNKPNPALLGRWIVEVSRGRFIVEAQDIRAVSPKRFERAIGIVSHYLIGISLAWVFLVVFSVLWAQLSESEAIKTHPGFVTAAVGYGLLTNLFPWFLMFPAMGFGVLARRSPPGAKLLKTSFCSHLIYGVGLAIGCWILSEVAAYC